jgi:hypothetical protein
MLFRQRIKTVAHVVELLNFLLNRVRMHGVRFPESRVRRFWLFGVADAGQKCVFGCMSGVGGAWIRIEGALLLCLRVKVSREQVSQIGVNVQLAGAANLFGAVTETL